MSSDVPELELGPELRPELELGPELGTELGQCGCREKGAKQEREVEGREEVGCVKDVLACKEVEADARQGRDENEVV